MGLFTGLYGESTLLWTRLAPGVKKYHLVTFYYAVLMTICSYTFINAAQSYVLSNMLDLEDLGKATGDLGFYNELLIIATVWIWGMLSDKYGRKPIYALGFFFMAAGIYLYPFATEFWILVMYRLIFALGASASAAMLTSVLADYVVPEDKGTASGFMGLFSGCGALLAALFLLQIPSWSSLDVIPAGRLMYIVTGSLVMVACLVVLLGLQGRTQNQVTNEREAYYKLIFDGAKAGYQDSRLALAYAAGFVARGDALVLTTFLSLWIQDYVVNEQGGTEDEAISKAGQITGIAQTCALIFALPAGYISSRIDSVLALLIMTVIALVGYTSICFTNDPTSTYGLLCACIIGFGEIGVIVSAQALASRQAPQAIRGSVGGTVGLCGSFGILICSKVGGILYDDWDPIGPFMLFACFNLLLIIFSIIVYVKNRLRAESSRLLLDDPAGGELEEEEEIKIKTKGSYHSISEN